MCGQPFQNYLTFQNSKDQNDYEDKEQKADGIDETPDQILCFSDNRVDQKDWPGEVTFSQAKKYQNSNSLSQSNRV